MDTLALKNAHPRDSRIVFFEIGHRYEIDGKGGYTSCTTWNHSLFAHFDAVAIVKKILKNPKWKKDREYKYFQQTEEEILAGWELNRDSAANAGTLMHLNIEKYYNGVTFDDTSIEFQYFQNFLLDYPFLEAFRTEWIIFDEELKISGSVDMVFRDTRTGEYSIYDWKRSKAIEYTSFYNKKALIECLRDVPDTNFYHYSLQLNTYKFLLEKNYGIKIKDLVLVVLHPDNDSKNYELYPCEDLSDRMEAIFDYRKKMLLDESTPNEFVPKVTSNSCWSGL
jgi:ATP-dependent exoDNAse (exonuclease V) beta subunit